MYLARLLSFVEVSEIEIELKLLTMGFSSCCSLVLEEGIWGLGRDAIRRLPARVKVYPLQPMACSDTVQRGR